MKRPLPAPLPAYARKTAAALVGGLMTTPVVREATDIGAVTRVLQDRVGQHEAQLQVGE